jgi:integrase
MARHTRAAKLETRTARLKLPIRGKPHFVAIAPRLGLGYRRNKTAGAWVVRSADGHGGNWTKVFALADDYEAANGGSVLDFWQAQDKARVLARAGDTQSPSDAPITVAEALDHYETALSARGGDTENVSRLRYHMPAHLLGKVVSLLNARELRSWRDGLVKKGCKPATADRTARVLAAALTLAAKDDPKRITNREAWKIERLPLGEEARNIILPDDKVRDIVSAAYERDQAFGLLVECAAVTGARASQILRLTVGDLQDKGPAPRLLMPSSRKGRRRRAEQKPLPIPASLAKALRGAAAGRASDALLLLRADGRQWTEIDRPTFRVIAASVGLSGDVTPYALRHSSIVRQLLANVPVRVVASHHDTSVPMIEKNYSKQITGDPSDAITRRALLDLAAPNVANVLPMSGKR